GDIFVAVGAAHLPGDRGVLNLLESKGFRITPLPFSP
ncbi:MAG TPA: TraB/GumN family protein, partial [Roseovarius nubinhibens]|nr:TraB/GumN family protein [Roseovarius nubinhibens]